MVISIQKPYVFKDVLITDSPSFFLEVLQRTIQFLHQYQVISNQKPYHSKEWIANIDTGVYVKTIEITSTDPAWEINGFFQELCYLDPPEIGVEHYLLIQNKAKGIRIAMTTLSKDNKFTVSFDIHLPFPLEASCSERLLEDV